MQIIDWIHAWAKTAPNRTAYTGEGRSLSYGALWTDAVRLSAALRQFPESRFLLRGGKAPEMVVGMLGCLLAGKTYVPISPELPAARLERILELTAPCKLLTADSSRIPDSILISALLEPLPAAEEPAVPENQPAYIIFTSGSTGTPKGVPIYRRNLDHFAKWICGLESMRLPAPARVMNTAAFSFDLSVTDLCYSLCSGHSLYAPEKDRVADPAGILDFMGTNRIEAVVCTPTFLKLCLLEPGFRTAQLSDLQVVYSCGEPLEKKTAGKLLERFPALRLINAYGPTEATSAVCAVQVTRELLEKTECLPVGRIDNAACRLSIDRDEIVLTGESVFSGYLDGNTQGWYLENGQATFRTGDLGSIEGNYLYCKGRRDRQIKWKGYRIELDEIEQTILSVPGVENCAVIAKKTETGTVRLIKAFVVLQSGTVDQLRSRLIRLLPDYMIPKSITELQELPTTENGKTDRKRLESL